MKAIQLDNEITGIIIFRNKICLNIFKKILIFIIIFYNKEGCGFCGGLGHKMADCNKLEQ